MNREPVIAWLGLGLMLMLQIIRDREWIEMPNHFKIPAKTEFRITWPEGVQSNTRTKILTAVTADYGETSVNLPPGAKVFLRRSAIKSTYP